MKLNSGDLKIIIEKVLLEGETFSNTFGNNNNNSNQQPVQNQPGDVKVLQKAQATATQVNKASQRINTTTEFSGAFKNWFNGLGYKPDQNVVNINRVLQLVKKSLQELGYK